MEREAAVTEVEAKAMGDSMDAGGGGDGFVAPTHRRGENEPGVRVAMRAPAYNLNLGACAQTLHQVH